MPIASFKADSARDTIQKWINEGRFEPGQKLPSELELSRQLGIHSQTLRQGLAQLAEEGTIVKQPRVGNFVSREIDIPTKATDIAVILPRHLFDVHSHTPVSLTLRGIYESFDPKETNISTLIYDTDQLWEDAGKTAAECGVKGVLLMPRHELSAADLDQFKQAGIHVVLLGRPLPSLEKQLNQKLWWAGVDPFVALGQIINRLAGLGHKRIATAHYTHSRWPKDRQLFNRCYEEAGLALKSDSLIPIPNKSVKADLTALHEIFDSDNRPTALIVPDEIIAANVLRLCYQRNIHIPDDLSLAVVGDHAPQLNTIELTGMDLSQIAEQIGSLAAKRLVQLIEDKELSPDPVVLRQPVRWTGSIGEAVKDEPKNEDLQPATVEQAPMPAVCG